MSWIIHCQGGVDDGGAATVRAIMHWQYRTISRKKTSILYNLNTLLGPKTHDYISFCGLRTYGRLFVGGPLVTSQVFLCITCLIYYFFFIPLIDHFAYRFTCIAKL